MSCSVATLYLATLYRVKKSPCPKKVDMAKASRSVRTHVFCITNTRSPAQQWCRCTTYQKRQIGIGLVPFKVETSERLSSLIKVGMSSWAQSWQGECLLCSDVRWWRARPCVLVSTAATGRECCQPFRLSLMPSPVKDGDEHPGLHPVERPTFRLCASV